LENSGHDRGNHGHTLRRREPFAKQKVPYAAITGNNAEFLHRNDRARRNTTDRVGREPSVDKPANSVIHRFRIEFWAGIVARIL
jgi:hypothetical protein